MMANIGQAAVLVVLAAVAIILHELAHGYAALALGDETALRQGRLSLNPLRHVDPVGTLLLPGFLLVSQLATIGRVAFMFGWAKPVPVDMRRFRKPRQMMALVALAGPAMNLALAFLAAHILRIDGLRQDVVDTVLGFIAINLLLGLFNLLPLPPLDGGRIMVGILPLPLARVWARIEPFGIPVVMGLLLLPTLLRQAGIAADPLGHVLYPAMNWILPHLLSLAGVRDA
jgi:Zn-dependent protease